MFDLKGILTLTSVMALSFGAATATAHAEVDRARADDRNDGIIQAYSKTIETSEVETPLPGDLMVFDRNGNGILEADEVGETLFYKFDLDGNGLIDNIEYGKKLDLSFAPVEKTRTVSIDYNNDGVIESEEVENEVVMKKTGLDRFSKDGDGVSPRDFIGMPFRKLDLNKSGLIEKDEWTRAYMEQKAPLAADNAIYNN